MYSYKETLQKEINTSIKELFGLNVTSATADKLIESGILNLKSEIIKIDNSIYRKCICTNMETMKSREFTLKLNNK